MIADQRQWLIDEKRRVADEQQRVARIRAEEDAQRKKLLDAIAVTVFDKGFDTSNYQDYVVIRVNYENKSGRDIRGFRGSIQFNDLFGVEIMPFRFSEDEPLPAGGSKKQTWTLKYNQFMDPHVKLRNTELSNLRPEWRPETILFADGSVLEVKGS